MTNNPFNAPVAQTTGAALPVEQSRAVSEVQAAMIIAKKFPRDQVAAYERIIQGCKRTTLAEGALYAYPRGGQTVTGPSIRLAEAIAQAWGNLQFGIRELSQANGESEVEAFAWDIETNTRQLKVFTVPHKRMARGSVKTLTDPRDIYEMVANQGARRLRACILGVIPGDVIEAAVKECERTLAGDNEQPLADRLRNMVVAFRELGVTKEMIEARLGHKLEATIATELVSLKKIYKSLQDGMSKRADWFDMGPQQSETAEAHTEALKAAANSVKASEPIGRDFDAQARGEQVIEEERASANPEADFVNEWVNMRGGFTNYVNANLDRFRAAPAPVQDKARQKWKRMRSCSGPFPLDESEPAPENQEQAPPAGDAPPEQETPKETHTENDAQVDLVDTPEWARLLELYDQHPDIYVAVRQEVDVSNANLTTEVCQLIIRLIEERIEKF